MKHASRGGGKSRNNRHQSDNPSGPALETSSAGHEHGCAASGKRRADFQAVAEEDAAKEGLALHGPVYFALGLCLGAAVYFSLSWEPGLSLVGVLAAVFVAAAIRALALAEIVWLRCAIIIGVGVAGGVALSKIHTELRPAPMITAQLGPTMVEGWIEAIEPGRNGVRLRLRVHAIGGERSDALPDEIRLTHPLSLNVAPGRFVRCWAVIRPPPEPGFPGDYAFNRQAFFEGLDGVGYVQGRCRGGTLGAPGAFDGQVQASIAMARRNLADHVREEAGPKAGGFAAALASGDRSYMSEADTEALRRSGLAHLLAISGLHLGIVGGMVYFAMRRGLALWEWLALRVPVQKPAALLALLATGIYMVLSGSSISTQRAFIMAAVFFGAILLDRAPLSFRSFAVAMIAVMILQPHSVMTPGFQMSFAATGALIATYLAWRRKRAADPAAPPASGPAFVLKSLVVTSIVGAVATAPFALYHFDRAAPGGIVANLLAMPIISFVSAPSAGLALVSAPVGLDGPFLRLFGFSLGLVLDVAHWVSSADRSGLSIGGPVPGAVLLAVTAGMAGACLLTGWKQRLRVASVASAVAAASWWFAPAPVLHWSASGEVMVLVRGEGWKKLDVVRGDGLSPLQFIDLETSGRCADGPCSFETGVGPVEIQTGLQNCPDGPAILLRTGAPEPACEGADVAYWDDVLRSNGTTWVKPTIGPVRRTTPRCGHRKWWPCLEANNETNQS